MPASRLRVAYDVSLLIHLLQHGHTHSGIGRVMQSLLDHLRLRSELNLSATAVSGCEDNADIILQTIKTQECWENRDVALKFDASFRSRLGLTRFYKNHFGHFYHLEAHPELKALESLPRRAYNRVALGILYRLAYRTKIDTITPELQHRNYQIFHSPYPALPSPQITRNAARILTIYDLIPLLAPQFVSAEATRSFQKIIDSVRIGEDWVGAISQWSKDEFCTFTGMSPDRVRVTPLAAGAHFRPVRDAAHERELRQRLKIPDGPYLLTLAEMQPRKNLPFLLRCFARILEAQPSREASLVLVGSRGWMFDEIFATARELEPWQSRLIFTGALSEDDLLALYNGARGFVFPSLYEGFGLPPLEAMQCGVPVVASNVTSLPEVLGDAAVLLSPRDETAWCHALEQVLDDDALCDDLKHRGLRRAQEFSWSRCAEETVQLYRTAVG